MLDPKFLRNDLEQVAARLNTRGFKLDVDALVQLEEKRKEIQVKTSLPSAPSAKRNTHRTSPSNSTSNSNTGNPLKIEPEAAPPKKNTPNSTSPDQNPNHTATSLHDRFQ